MDQGKLHRGFLLTGEWEDLGEEGRLRLTGIGEEGPFEILITDHRPLLFIEQKAEVAELSVPYERKSLELQTFAGQKVDGLYFKTQKALEEANEALQKKGIRTYEADVRPGERFLMERFIQGGIEFTGEGRTSSSLTLTQFLNPKIRKAQITPVLKVTSLDIETGRRGELYSIALHTTLSPLANSRKLFEDQRVFMVGPPKPSADGKLFFFPNERDLLLAFIDYFQTLDPDFLIGWHVVGFDLKFLQEKCSRLGLTLAIGRNKAPIYLKDLPERSRQGTYAKIPGRVIVDGPKALREAFYQFENFKLDTVAKELLGKGKDIGDQEDKVGEIERRFREDKEALAHYNLLDAILVTEIFNKINLLDFLIKRSQISGLLIDRLGSSTGAFDYFMLPRVHRKGLVASNVLDIKREEDIQGGHVLEPKIGLHENVIVLDFKSLYPSIINTFKIDPLSRVRKHINPLTTPVGLSFSRTEHLLPEFIEQLMELRKVAKSKKDHSLAQAIKILMNSFYGVMGSPLGRFYHGDLAGAITGTGQWVLKTAKNYLESKQYEVVYGDTDSLFIKLKKEEKGMTKKVGEQLTRELNQFMAKKIQKDFQLESHLEIEFEKYYRKFYLSPLRQGEGGAKKRYVGLLVQEGQEELQFVGMEFVRSDWTKLAKRFQHELFRRFFYEEDMETFIKSFLSDLKNHLYDKDLVYKKKLSKDPREYTRNIPPHVRAALLLQDDPGHSASAGPRFQREIYYVMTLRGPIPIQKDHPDLDYEHYIEKQIRPIASSVLQFLGMEFDQFISGDQLSLF